CFYVLTAHGQFRNLLSTDTATSTLYTLSLHDALPILHASWMPALGPMNCSESFAKKHCTTGLSPSGIASYFMSATSKPLTGTCFRGAPSVCGPFIPPSINFFPSVSTPSAAVCPQTHPRI